MNSKRFFITVFSSFLIGIIVPNILYGQKAQHTYEGFSVAAYVWPSCHDEEMSRTKLWGEGIGEWEIIKKGDVRFDGHYQPRVPLWGHLMDNDPKVWEKKIKAATDHNVNVFIFDWYWYDNKPFLEESVNSFLKAENKDHMKFYLMWANHDVPGNMWNYHRYDSDSLLWQGRVDWDKFTIIVDRVINQYFKQPNYFKINNEPVFSIFSAWQLVASFDGIEGTVKALNYFRMKVKEAGFAGLHLQFLAGARNEEPNLLGAPYGEGISINKLVSDFGINSFTAYNWNSSKIVEDYLEWGANSMKLQNKWDSLLTIPYFPNVSIGWDDTPRYPTKGRKDVVHYNNSPESFGAFLQIAKEYLKKHPEQPKLIVINSWNEWVEGSYLEPDMRWGFSYLEAVKKVMGGQYDPYFQAKKK